MNITENLLEVLSDKKQWFSKISNLQKCLFFRVFDRTEASRVTKTLPKIPENVILFELALNVTDIYHGNAKLNDALNGKMLKGFNLIWEVS